MRGHRGMRAVLAFAALALAVSPAVSGAAGTCADEGRRSRPDGWTVLNPPTYSLGDGKTRAWAASAFVDGFLLATNGGTIARSLDGGCTWEETYVPGVGTSGEARLVSDNSSLYDVAMPPSRMGRLDYLVYGLVSDLDGSRLLRSDDLGESWEAMRSLGLPPIVTMHGMWVSADPRTVFVLVDSRSAPTSVVETTLYVTRDSGLTFAPVRRGLDPGQYEHLALDPIDTRQVWAWDEDSLFHSTDGGASFAKVAVDGPISTVDVLHYPAFQPATVMAFESGEPSASRSVNGGLTWTRERTPGIVTGTANLYEYDVLAMASDRGVHLRAPGFLPPGQALLDVSPARLEITEVAFSLVGARGLALYGRAGSDLYVRRFTPQLRAIAPPKPPRLPPLKDLRPGEVAAQGPTALTPATATVKLRAGETKRVDYSLNLAPVPTPLDVFFATDSTGSMGDVIVSLRANLQDIIDDLSRSGIDVWFGVGDFKDYPVPGFGGPTDYPYKRHRAVGPADDELADAIEAIEVGGGLNDDSALAATYQAATGAGQRVVENRPEAGDWVKPYQGAEWRPEALKVVVIAADVLAHDPERNPGYPGPSYAKVIAALNRRGIEHVGLAVGDTPSEPAQSLARVSRGTGTVAPPGGIDCDDDGETDVAEGEPLVCELPTGHEGTSLAPAMIGLLRSIQDLQTVGLGVRGDRRVATVGSASVFDSVNVKQPNRLPFSVDASCTLDTAGQSFDLAVEGTVASRVVATARLRVECEALPEVERHGPPPVTAAVVAPLAPAVPAPIPQPQPNVNPNPNPNPNPATNVQAGAAHQDQTEVQLALAYQSEQDPAVAEELAMVGLALGAAMASACALAYRRRTRHAVARAYYE